MSRNAARLRAMVDAIVARGSDVNEAVAALSGLYQRAQTKRSRGGGQRSKAKGRQFMLDVATLITRAFGLDADDVFVKATSQVGCDLHLSPRAARVFPFSIEGKKVESLNIWGALRQAEANATPGKPPVVFFARAYSGTYVAVPAEVFLELARRAEESGKGAP